MTLIAAIGQSQVMDAREAGMQAIYQALNSLGTVTPSLCILIVPHRYDPVQVINGAASMLSNAGIQRFIRADPERRTLPFSHRGIAGGR